MLVKEMLSVSAVDFFNEIVRSILTDIQKQTNKTMHASQIKPGLTYKKHIRGRFSTNAEVTIKVLQCIPNKVYESSYTSAIDLTTTKYEIEGLENGRIQVMYSESYTLLHKKQERGKKIFAEEFLDKTSEKRGRKLLKHIEGYILRQKGHV